MITRNYTAEGQTLRLADNAGPLAAREVCYHLARFSCYGWEDIPHRVAVFQQGENLYRLLLTENCCVFPAELSPGSFTLSLFGYGQDGQRASTAPLQELILEGDPDSDPAVPVPPTPDLYAQLVRQVESARTAAEAAAETAQAVTLYPPRLSDRDTWLLYSTESGEYRDTGLYAGGQAPAIGENGNWFVGGQDTGFAARAQLLPGCVTRRELAAEVVHSLEQADSSLSLAAGDWNALALLPGLTGQVTGGMACADADGGLVLLVCDSAPGNAAGSLLRRYTCTRELERMTLTACVPHAMGPTEDPYPGSGSDLFLYTPTGGEPLAAVLDSGTDHSGTRRWSITFYTLQLARRRVTEPPFAVSAGSYSPQNNCFYLQKAGTDRIFRMSYDWDTDQWYSSEDFVPEAAACGQPRGLELSGEQLFLCRTLPAAEKPSDSRGSAVCRADLSGRVLNRVCLPRDSSVWQDTLLGCSVIGQTLYCFYGSGRVCSLAFEACGLQQPLRSLDPISPEQQPLLPYRSDHAQCLCISAGRGSDVHGDGTPVNPFRTPKYAFRFLRSGYGSISSGVNAMQFLDGGPYAAFTLPAGVQLRMTAAQGVTPIFSGTLTVTNGSTLRLDCAARFEMDENRDCLAVSDGGTVVLSGNTFQFSGSGTGAALHLFAGGRLSCRSGSLVQLALSNGTAVRADGGEADFAAVEGTAAVGIVTLRGGVVRAADLTGLKYTRLVRDIDSSQELGGAYAALEQLRDRLDQTIIHAGDGTPEVTDARAAATGTVYSCLKNRLDTEYSTLSGGITSARTIANRADANAAAAADSAAQAADKAEAARLDARDSALAGSQAAQLAAQNAETARQAADTVLHMAPCPVLTWTIGSSISASGVFGGNSYAACTPALPCAPGDILVYTGGQAAPPIDAYAHFYSEAGDWLGRQRFTAAPARAPETAAAVRIAFGRTSSSGIKMTQEELDLFDCRMVSRMPTQSDLQSGLDTLYQTLLRELAPALPWAGKRVVCLGDSLTFGNTGTVEEGSRNANSWVTHLQRLCGFASVTNAGDSGSRLVLGRDDSFSLRVRDLPEADLYVVMGGINDAIFASPLGAPGQTYASDEEMASTFYGAVEYLIRTLTAQHPEARVVFLLPPKYCISPDLYQTASAYDSGMANRLGYTQKDYMDAIREVCGRFSVPVRDLFNESGISPYLEEHRRAWLGDGLHYRIAGYQRLAETVIAPFLNHLV